MVIIIIYILNSEIIILYESRLLQVLFSWFLGLHRHSLSLFFLQVGADESDILDQIINSLSSIANRSENSRIFNKDTNTLSLKVGRVGENSKKKPTVLIIGAGRVCQPAAELLASIGTVASRQWFKTCMAADCEELNDITVIVASLYLKDAEEV